MAGSVWWQLTCLTLYGLQILSFVDCSKKDPGHSCRVYESQLVLTFSDWILQRCPTNYNVTLTLFSGFNPKGRLLQECYRDGIKKGCINESSNAGASLSVPIGFRIPCDPRFAGDFISEVTCSNESGSFNTSLTVLDFPTTPVVNKESSVNDTLQLRCNSESRSFPVNKRRNLTYTWLVDGFLLDGTNYTTVSGDHGEILHIEGYDGRFENATCVVQENGSNLLNNVTYLIERVAPATTATATILKPDATPSMVLDEDSNKATGLYITAGVLGAVALISLFIILILLLTRKRKVNRNVNTTTITFRNRSAESTPLSSPFGTSDRRTWNNSLNMSRSPHLTSPGTYSDIEAMMTSEPNAIYQQPEADSSTNLLSENSNDDLVYSTGRRRNYRSEVLPPIPPMPEGQNDQHCFQNSGCNGALSQPNTVVTDVYAKINKFKRKSTTENAPQINGDETLNQPDLVDNADQI